MFGYKEGQKNTYIDMKIIDKLCLVIDIYVDRKIDRYIQIDWLYIKIDNQM